MRSIEHQKRHAELHNKLDELLADFIQETGKLPSKTPIIDLINWSYYQTKITPAEGEKKDLERIDDLSVIPDHLMKEE